MDIYIYKYKYTFFKSLDIFYKNYTILEIIFDINIKITIQILYCYNVKKVKHANTNIIFEQYYNGDTKQ